MDIPVPAIRESFGKNGKSTGLSPIKAILTCSKDWGNFLLIGGYEGSLIIISLDELKKSIMQYEDKNIIKCK